MVGDKSGVKFNSEPIGDTTQVRRETARAAPADCVSGLDAMTETKLWRNPCWLSFRLNYLALRYNVPLYDWVQRTYGLSRPEYVVLFSLGLHDRATATEISASSGFPKNTLSRATQKLLHLRLIESHQDPADGRGRILQLSAPGRRLFEASLPRFVDFEKQMLETLTQDERETLSRLLAKIVLDSPRWRSEVVTE